MRGRATTYILLIGLSVVFLLPLLWLVSTSLKPIGETMSLPPRLLPSEPHWENYRDALASMGGTGAERVTFCTSSKLAA